ncbi:hypothetical protein LTR91_015498 [Friedmanniomyces endolithicus]|uniref:Uncharacterized protein n=1 Tax=Friedmanniomyces endolithicus TaxID=329885 RepID=A0AAN6K9R2_9PEZI|nr:hypothetical protein LTR75_008101 [Friedmanniomyces endolithicus]KAK0839231.1 hypothetical protein LTS02_017544 [Friedmanniomyces endolithicus]KAK0846289.1 hypothetical protein LTR03_006942 [Friedmanniomyces endolithicus]KAK0881522.1 hypothetical protein LTR87_004663 [Friedmanniomyces endolithicus]KAK0910951.1 hypothetical protein LTR02_003649 [Friedmanniomyces endolithicus]
MDILDRMDLNAGGNLGEWEAQTVPEGYEELLLELEQRAEEGSLLGVKAAIGALRDIGADELGLKYLSHAFYLAVQHSYVDLADYLLSAGAEISSYDGKTAAENKDKATLELLIHHGWDINQRVNWSVPPALAFAVEDIDLCHWFISHGADPNAGCGLDKTPLSAAVQYGPLEVIELLFNHGGAIECGQLLHFAVWRHLSDRLDVVRYIIRKGASVNMLMYQNRPDCYIQREAFGLGTPLHAAATEGDMEVVRLLLDEGADISIQDSLGKLPYQLAEMHGHEAIATLLQPSNSRVGLLYCLRYSIKTGLVDRWTEPERTVPGDPPLP